MSPLLFEDFEAAGYAVLRFLRQRYGYQLWMIARTEGEDWIVLQTENHGYDIQPGSVFPWSNTICKQMVAGHGPRIAPQLDTIPAYAQAAVRNQAEINAYVGMPLMDEQGELFGTLCGLDPVAQSDDILKDQALLELLASLLSSVLQAELKTTEAKRTAERLKVEAMTDGLTKIYNRRAWDELLEKEEGRCRRYGHPAAVIIIDLNELKAVNDKMGHAAGDELIIRTAKVLRNTARISDVVARLGGDEFGLLAVECHAYGAEEILRKLRVAFSDHQIKASFGMSPRSPLGGLSEAAEVADRRMLVEKQTQQRAKILT